MMGLGPSPANKDKTLSFSHRNWRQKLPGIQRQDSAPERVAGPLGQTEVHPSRRSFSFSTKSGEGALLFCPVFWAASHRSLAGMGRAHLLLTSQMSSFWKGEVQSLWPSPQGLLS